MKKNIINIIFGVIYISAIEGMKRDLPKGTKSLIPLTSQQRTNCARLIGHDVLLDDIQTNIALHMIVDFLLIPKKVEGHTQTVWSVAIQDNILVTGSADHTAKIWDINTCQLLHTLAEPKGHIGGIKCVAIHNDKIVTGSTDGAAKIWDVNTGQLLHTLYGPDGHTYGILSVTINSQKVVTGSWDHTAKIWDVETGQLLHTFVDHYYPISFVAIYNNKVLTDGFTFKIWDIETGELLLHIFPNYINTTMPNYAIDNNILASKSYKNEIKIWNLETCQELNTFTPPSHSYFEGKSIAIHNNTVVTGLYDNTAKIRNINTGKPLYKVRGHTKNITSIAANKNTIVTGSLDRTALIYRLQLDLNIDEFTNPEHALFWIKHYILPYQAHLIARAHAMTENPFTINITTDDAITWVTFPAHVRDYLVERLNIELTK